MVPWSRPRGSGTRRTSRIQSFWPPPSIGRGWQRHGRMKGGSWGLVALWCDLYDDSKISILVFPKIVVPQNGWFIRENRIKMDDLEVPIFLETPIWCISLILYCKNQVYKCT